MSHSAEGCCYPRVMNRVRDAAEAVLFGDTLDAKLTPLHRLDDEAPGPPRAVPAAPGRPASLLRSDVGLRTKFPSLSQLEDDAARARMLHFLANHELLALELMALMLLRFPAAAREERQGWLAIMADEQRHLTLYLDRMRELGLDFGDLDVGFAFWDALAHAESPAAFNVGMGLTLEQANLDHAAALTVAMERVGDAPTARILERVLEDEVRHVRHGVVHLQRADGESMWDAWERTRPPTLGPADARGKPFRRDLRLRAGLDEAFVDRLEIAAARRPRRPDVWWFDPGCEEELAGRGDDKASRAIARALEGLPLLFAPEGDLVIVSGAIEKDTVAGLRALGLGRAEPIAESAVLEREPRQARPWGMSPRSSKRATTFGIDSRWNDAMAEAYRKSLAARLAAAGRAEVADERLLDARDEPTVVQSLEDIETALTAHLARHDTVVLKADFKTAGRRTRRVGGGLGGDDRAWCCEVLARDGAIVVEPWLDRVIDLSTHLTITDSGVRFDGVVRFETDPRGAFLGAWVSPSHRGLPSELARFIAGDGKVAPLSTLLRAFAEAAARKVADLGFTGTVATDALICRDLNGELRLRPLVELNPRRTMGRIALDLSKRVARNVPAYWAVLTRKRLRRLAPEGLDAWLTNEPPRIEATSDGPRLMSGVLPTTTRRAAADVVTLLGAGEVAHRLARV